MIGVNTAAKGAGGNVTNAEVSLDLEDGEDGGDEGLEENSKRELIDDPVEAKKPAL